MAGIIKPNNVKQEMIDYIINGFNVSGSSKIGLFDGNISYEGSDSLGAYWYSSTNFIDITINKKCSLYCLSGGGYEKYNGKLTILKWNGTDFETSDIEEKIRSSIANTWTKTVDCLPAGRYKFVGGNGYRFDSEWYFEDLQYYKFLIKQNNQYYTIKSEFYLDNNYNPLSINTQPNVADIETYGFDDISILNAVVTVDNEPSFKPIIKLNNNFEIKKYITN